MQGREHLFRGQRQKLVCLRNPDLHQNIFLKLARGRRGTTGAGRTNGPHYGESKQTKNKKLNFQPLKHTPFYITETRWAWAKFGPGPKKGERLLTLYKANR